MTPFDIVKSFRTKIPLPWNDIKGSYQPFIINRALSFDINEIFFANEINKHSLIEHKWQHAFFEHTIPKTKKFIQWIKSEEEDLGAISRAFNCSKSKAVEISQILTDEQKQILISKYADK